MRLVAAAALALAVAVPAAASPVGTQPLAADEVLLEVNEIGSAVSRADLATFRIAVTGSGATGAEARRAAEGAIARLAAAARDAGIAAADFSRSPVIVDTPPAPGDPEVEAAVRDLERAAAAVEAAAGSASEPARPEPHSSASIMVTILVRNIDRVPALQHALRGGEDSYISEPTYSLTDSRRARQEARRQAIAAARADAEDYAAALGLRVVRIVRVTERVGTDVIGMMMSDSTEMRRLLSMNEGQGGDITTAVALGMDFVLAPR